jgi:glycerol kinase
LESIAYQTVDVLQAMEADSGIGIKELRVDGGAVVNNLLMQFQSDIAGIPVIRPQVTETTALGAAYLAGLAVGFWNSIDDLQHQWKPDREFLPAMDSDKAKMLLHGWNKAIEAAKNSADN